MMDFCEYVDPFYGKAVDGYRVSASELMSGGVIKFYMR